MEKSLTQFPAGKNLIDLSTEFNSLAKGVYILKIGGTSIQKSIKIIKD